MAITRIYTTGGTQNDVNPAYNNLTYYFTSDNKNQKGFRYVAKVKSGANVLLFEKTIIPTITTGDCQLQLNKELSDYLNFTFDETKLDMVNYDATDSYQDYKIEMYEEYYYTYDWYEYVYAYKDTPYWPRGNNQNYNPGLRARTALVSSSNTMPLFSVGDWIYVDQPITNDITASINGTNKILDIVNVGASIPGIGYVGWMIVLDRLYVGNSSTNGGTIRFDDNRKTRSNTLLTISDQSVFNGYLNKSDYLKYDDEDYKMDNRVGRDDINFLTNLPTDGYECRADDIFMMNYLSVGVPPTNQANYIVFENDTGDVIRQTLTRAALWGVSQISVGPAKDITFQVINGTLPVVKPNTKWYTFHLTDSGGVQLSKKYKLNVDRSCNSIDALKLVYMDKMGSFLSFNFDARNLENINVKRELYKQYLGGPTDKGYGYKLTDAGTKQYHQMSETSYELNTGYLNTAMSDMFKYVLESPVTFLQINGELVRCNMSTTNITVKKEGWFEQKQYKVKVTLSNDEGINY